ncbi:hypothetical protein AMATHDRAFT_87318 [Amanita thiersii Skay4041]|uniref:Macro domain-containing protein n=1 Tax=Amanita thiersii Skay4041 TaxID=703135 RepID=A0A2A9NFM8_9AGAR|nr:hypothetical protein AMATHDRAFT_87318 [Amanita thiersii Skay4041]
MQLIPVPLSEIPTLAQLYRDSVLHPPVSAKRSCHASLLDRVSLYQGDITRLKIDAIVNAANKSLLGSGEGVDGAVHKAAGPGLFSECRRLRGCPTGRAKLTRGYDLPACCIIHTVGPAYNSFEGQDYATQLASCYKLSLEIAASNSLRHIAFPAISAGRFCYPIDEASHIALNEIREFCLSEAGKKLERIILVAFRESAYEVYKSIIPEYFPPSERAE